MKVYVEFFRFKKHEYREKGSHDILKKNLAYFSIIFLTVLFILSNIQSKNEVSAATENEISKTVMASLVQNRFSSLSNDDEEELIVDSYIPSTDFVAEQKKSYLEATMEKKTGLMEEVKPETNTSDPILINDDAIAVKPKGLANMTSDLAGDTEGSSQSTKKRNEIVNYTVQKGDTISSIASRFDVTINTILWANDLASYSVIRPGDILSILPSSGVVHTVKSGDTISRIASVYNISENEILNSNNIGAVLKIGEKVMVPGGVKPRAVVATKPKPAPTTGASIIRDLVKTPEPPVNDTPAAASGKMAWPTEGRRITQYYSWRHTGLDIANKTGTPLYAVEAGTVEYSGWSNGYGYNVLINHGGGKKTRYAHASQLYVKSGDGVSRGQTIAAMGSTGWSTGPHIHFEVIINGTKYNPLNYIK